MKTMKISLVYSKVLNIDSTSNKPTGIEFYSTLVSLEIKSNFPSCPEYK